MRCGAWTGVGNCMAAGSVAGRIRSRRRPLSLEPSRGAHRSSPRSSSRNSACWSQGYLSSIPGRNLDGKADCDLARTSGGNGACYPARNRTRISRCCSRGSGRNSGGCSRTSSPCRPSPGSSGRDSASYGDNYGGGIGGVRAAKVSIELRIDNLGCTPSAGGICAILHKRRSGIE